MIVRGGWMVVVCVTMAACKPVVQDPCAEVTCGSGRCVVSQGIAECLCELGFEPSGLRCEAIDGPCAANPCAGLSKSECEVHDGTARCVCPASHVEANGTCVPRTPCLPSPCSTGRLTTCDVVDGDAVCSCAPGYAPQDGGCSEQPAWTCTGQHEGDAFEPDECPPLAKRLEVGVEQTRTSSPEGDQDWASIEVTPGHVYELQTQSSTLLLGVELFDRTGLTPLASDVRGSTRAFMRFLAPADGQGMLRIKAVRANQTGDYRVWLRDLGLDDYANDPASALSFSPGTARITGEVQYPDDVDVALLELAPAQALRIAFDAGDALSLTLTREDGGVRTFGTGGSSTLSTAARETLQVRIRANDGRALEPFDVSIDALGRDDHSDDPFFATRIDTAATEVPGVFERTDDIDSFQFSQQAGHYYRALWSTAQPDDLRAGVLDLDGRVVAQSMIGRLPGLLWKAERASLMVLRLRSEAGLLSPYALRVEDLGPSDHPDGGTALTLNVPVEARVEASDEPDVFTFSAVPGRIIRLTATPLASLSQPPPLSIIDPSGNVVAFGNGVVNTLMRSPGVHRVRVNCCSQPPDPSNLPRYTLTATDVGVDDHGDLLSTASPLSFGMPATAAWQYEHDLDAFSFTAQQGHVYTLSCSRGAGSCFVGMFDATGRAVLDELNFRGPYGFEAANSGQWMVRVKVSYYAGDPTPATLTLTDDGVEDHGSTQATATPFVLGSTISARLGYVQDVDVFGFPVIAGRVYRAATDAGATVTLIARSDTGAPIASSSTGELRWLAPSNGTGYLFISTGTTVRPYTLHIEAVGPDDHGNTPGGATASTLGTLNTSEIQFGDDVDVIRLPVAGGRHHLIHFVAGVTQCRLSVSSSAAELAAIAGADLRFSTPSTVNEIFVSVTAQTTARCEFIVSDLGPDDHGDLRTSATPLVLDAPDASVSVLEQPTDRDVFAIDTVPGEILALQCVTRTGPACVLDISIPARPSPVTVQDDLDFTSAFQSTPGGRWYVVVRNAANTQGSYELRARRGQDDHTSTSPLTLGVPVVGRYDHEADTDAFSVVLSAADVVTVTIDVGIAAVRSANGFQEYVFAGSSRSIAIPADGTYVITVFDTGDTVATYTLLVQ